MIKLYRDEDLYDAVLQRRRILGVFFGVLGAYLAGLIALIVYYISLPFEDPNATWVIWVTGILTTLFLFFSFPFMGIKFKRCNSYCKMLKFISVGLKEYSVSPFLEIDDWVNRDGVDVNVANFAVKGVKRNETMIRSIYVDGEKPFPPFREGDIVKMISQGNLLIEYEIERRKEEVPQTEEIEKGE